MKNHAFRQKLPVNHILMIYLIAFFLIVLTNLAIPQDLSLEEILKRAQKTFELQQENNKAFIYEYTERIIVGKISKEGEFEKADTVYSRVKMRGDEELSREIVYSHSESEKEKPDKKKSEKENKKLGVDIDVELTIDNPDYVFELVDDTAQFYVRSSAPRKKKPDKGQIKGKYFIDKESFLIKTMDFEVLRPEKVKELKMHLDFTKLDEGPYVMTDMEMRGRVKILFGVINVRFRVAGQFYDYRVLENEEFKETEQILGFVFPVLTH